MALVENNPSGRTDAVQKTVWFEQIPASYWVVGVLLLIMPAFANDFTLYQVFGWTFILGMISLSLMFLGGYGGMVSLVQMSVAGLAGYMVAIFGQSAITDISLGWPWYIAIPLALVVAMLFGTIVGSLAVRTEGIYTIMITLAVAAAFFYFTRQNYVIFNGFSGFNGVVAPQSVRRGIGGRPYPSIISRCSGRAVAYFHGPLYFPGALRSGAAGGTRQSAPDGGARLQR